MYYHEFGTISESTKRIKELINQVSDLGEDGSVTIEDVNGLTETIDNKFTDNHSKFVSFVRDLLTKIISDRSIDEQERISLKNLSIKLKNPVSDTVIEDINAKKFVLTGDFEVEGGKETMREMLEAAGGVIQKNSPNKKTDYVVVGKCGSRAWAFDCFGIKVMKALELQLIKKLELEIISEDTLMNYLRKNDQASSVLKNKQNRFAEQKAATEVVSSNFTGLTNGQKQALSLVQEGKNVLLTGLGGTGKSYILEKIISWAKESGKNTIVCAPTGIAALNIKGSTIHHVLGIGPNRPLENSEPYVKKDSPLSGCDLMIVDEISMCRMDLFDYLSKSLENAAKFLKKDHKKAQLVVVGDFYQLPPVASEEDKIALKNKYGFEVDEAYPFMGTEWSKWNFEKVELVEAIRQRNKDFVEALNACRIGDFSGVKWIQDHSAKQPQDKAITLCGHNKVADSKNKQMLDKLNTPSIVYVADISGEVSQQDMPTNKKLVLKPGARVMSVANGSSNTYMNGTLGTVVTCDENEVIVSFDNLGKFSVKKNRWEILKPVIKEESIKSEVIGTFTQIPLKLAWAITIHKAQGQTFDSANIYPKCWDSGQLYTALSRLTSIEGLYLCHEISNDFLKTSKHVLQFLEGTYKFH